MSTESEVSNYLLSGNDFYRQGKYLDACEVYKRATLIAPNHTDAYNNWGLALAALKRYEEAIEQYKQAIAKDPNHAWAYNNWGAALAALKRYEEAIEQY